MKILLFKRRSYFGQPAAQERKAEIRFQRLRFAVCSFAVLSISNYLLQNGLPQPAFLLFEPRAAEAGIVISAEEREPVVNEPSVGDTSLIVARDLIPPGERLRPELFEVFRTDSRLVPSRVLREADLAEISGKYSRIAIEPGTMITAFDLTSGDHFSTNDIPVGHRAVTVELDGRSGVEGYARPGSLVDILWVANDPRDRADKVATVASRARVLSIAGSTSSGARGPVRGSFNATLILPEFKAKQVELAVHTGRVSFALIGDHESSVEAGEVKNSPFEKVDILRPRRAPGSDYCVTRNPISGAQERFVLTERGWEKDQTGIAAESSVSQGGSQGIGGDGRVAASEEKHSAEPNARGKAWHINS